MSRRPGNVARVEIVGHDRPTLQALGRALDRDDIEVLGIATTLEDVRELVEDRRVDVIVAADGIGRDEVLALARELFDADGEARLLVTGVPDSPAVVMGYIEAGAIGIVPPDKSLEELVAAVRAVSRGQAWLSRRFILHCMRRVAELVRLCEGAGINSRHLARLTDKEMEVLDLLGERLSNAQIAKRLFVTVATVKSHVHSILKKLGVHRREEAVAYLTVAGHPAGETEDPAQP